ncbi:MAG: glycosyltransferase family 39 protein, partial [Candidatus Xenobia bacterium]
MTGWLSRPATLWRHWAALFIVAAAVRILPSFDPSLGVDDGVSWLYAHQPTYRLLWNSIVASHEVHPPLYFFWLHFWLGLVPHRVGWLRLSSILWGLLTIPVVHRLGQRLFDDPTAALAALLTALSAFLAVFCEELRMYSMVTFFLTLAALALVERAVPLYVVSATLALYTQYLAAVVLCIMGVAWLVSQRQWRFWLLAQGLTALAFLPWLPTLWQQAHSSFTLRPPPATGWPLELLFQMAYGWTFPRPLADWGSIDPIKLGVGLLLPLAILRVRRAAWVTATVAITIAVVGLISSVTPLHIFEYKYLSIIDPLFLLLAAAALTQLPVPVRKGLILLFVAFNLLSMALFWQDPLMQPQDWRDATAWLLPRLQVGDAVVLHPAMMVAPFAFYGGRATVPADLQLLPTD